MQGELLRGTHGPFRKINNYNVATRDIGRAAALPPIVDLFDAQNPTVPFV